MKRGSHHFSLADGHGIATLGGNHFDFRSDVFNLWCPDEDHFGGIAEKLSFADRAFELTAVCVAADRDIENPEAFLSGVPDFAGEKNCARARPERWLDADKLLQLLETFFAEELEKRRGLAAGDDEAVDLIELLGLFDEHGFRSELFEPFAMRVKVALQGKDADGHGRRSSLVVRRWLSALWELMLPKTLQLQKTLQISRAVYDP